MALGYVQKAKYFVLNAFSGWLEGEKTPRTSESFVEQLSVALP